MYIIFYLSFKSCSRLYLKILEGILHLECKIHPLAFHTFFLFLPLGKRYNSGGLYFLTYFLISSVRALIPFRLTSRELSLFRFYIKVDGDKRVRKASSCLLLRLILNFEAKFGKDLNNSHHLMLIPFGGIGNDLGATNPTN